MTTGPPEVTRHLNCAEATKGCFRVIAEPSAGREDSAEQVLDST